jgi:hypothetical protein
VSIKYGSIPNRKIVHRGFSIRARMRVLRDIATDKRISARVRLAAVQTAEVLQGNLTFIQGLAPSLEKFVHNLAVQPQSEEDLLT